MKALCWYGSRDVRVENVPDPHIINPRDIIVRVTLAAICGSDVHIYDGYIPSMERGDILGHEFMGEVVEIGQKDGLQVGDRVVVPFPIACGRCFYCQNHLYASCDNSNPNAASLEALQGYSSAGLFGYSHLYGGYAGGQAEYVRVPFGDVGPLKVPDGMTDEQALFLSDILPTGYMAAENCDIKAGDTVAVWGCGPVGQFAIRSAFLLGAARVIAIDRFPERLDLARRANAETIDYEEEHEVVARLKEMTGGQGPDSCIDAVGLEAHGTGIGYLYDRSKQMLRLQMDRPTALREIIQACRKNGTVSLAGVYIGLIDKMPLGVAFGKGLTFKMGQTHAHRYMRPLLEKISGGQIDPSVVITHRMRLDEAPEGYRIFADKKDNCIKVVLRP
jgi:threonine dehydrogenase-like Zn-dependent dehydrogenase